MKVFMDFEEHKAMKEKRSKKMKAKMKQDYEDDLEAIIRKKGKSKKTKHNKSFKNNYSDLEDYDEEDFYDTDYDINKIK